MAEEHLCARGVEPSQWPGLRFRWADNLADAMWASVVVEIERRDDQWIITRLDRNRDSLENTGFLPL